MMSTCSIVNNSFLKFRMSPVETFSGISMYLLIYYVYITQEKYITSSVV